MADELLGNIGPMLSGIGDTGYMIIVYGGILLIFLGIFIFIYWWTSYNINYRIRELSGDKTRIIDDKAKRVKTREGIIKWKLRSRKDYVPIPPKEAIHYNRNGKACVEAYYTPEHEYKYIDDKGMELTTKIDKQYSYLVDKGIIADTLQGFKPITTSDREFYANEERLAQKYLKKNWTDYILPIAGIIAIIIILVCMFIFWEDITKPTLEAQKTNLEVAKIQTEMLKEIKEIIRHSQIVGDYNMSMPDIPADLNNKVQVIK